MTSTTALPASTAELLAVACASPGPAAVAAVAELRGRALAPDEMLDVVAAVERQSRWWTAVAGQWLVAACEPEPGKSADDVEADAAAVAAVLRVGPRTAANRLAAARALHQDLPATAAALEAGEVGAMHAMVLVEAAWGLSPEPAAAVEAATLPAARVQTVGRFRRTVAVAVLSVDPAAAARRQAAAVADRGVRARFDTCATEGLAHLDAALPASDAFTVLSALDKVGGRCRPLRCPTAPGRAGCGSPPAGRTRSSRWPPPWSTARRCRAVHLSARPECRVAAPPTTCTSRCGSPRTCRPCSGCATGRGSSPASGRFPPPSCASSPHAATRGGGGGSPTPSTGRCSTAARGPTGRPPRCASSSPCATAPAGSPAATGPPSGSTSTTASRSTRAE